MHALEIGPIESINPMKINQKCQSGLSLCSPEPGYHGLYLPCPPPAFTPAEHSERPLKVPSFAPWTLLPGSDPGSSASPHGSPHCLECSVSVRHSSAREDGPQWKVPACFELRGPLPSGQWGCSLAITLAWRTPLTPEKWRLLHPTSPLLSPPSFHPALFTF